MGMRSPAVHEANERKSSQGFGHSKLEVWGCATSNGVVCRYSHCAKGPNLQHRA